VVFAAVPSGEGRSQFAVGDLIYATVMLDGPMRTPEDSDVEGTLTVEIGAGDSPLPCSRITLHGGNPVEDKLLAARTFSVDVVRPPFPSRVREPDIAYDRRCLDRYEEGALRSTTMTIVVRLEASTRDGRVKKTLAEGHASITVSDAQHALAELHRAFARDAILPPNHAPDWSAAALDATKAYMRDAQTTGDVPLTVSLAADTDASLFDASIVFRRPDATCFVQPGLRFVKELADKPQCQSDAEMRAITALVKSMRSSPQLELAYAEWEAARRTRDRMRKLREHLLVSQAELEAAEADETKRLIMLRALVPAIRHLAPTVTCRDTLRLSLWRSPNVHDGDASAHAEAYDIACDAATR